MEAKDGIVALVVTWLFGYFTYLSIVVIIPMTIIITLFTIFGYQVFCFIIAVIISKLNGHNNPEVILQNWTLI